jgi:uncharacterized membrane protein YkvA (DUF1232 family)
MKQAAIDDILEPGDDAANERRAKRVVKGFWRTFARAARHIPFAEELVAAYYAALDPKTPFRVRGTLLAALAYFVLPFDIVPDMLLGIGFTDDIAVLTAALAAVRPHIRARHHNAARAAIERFAQNDQTDETGA